MADIHDIARQLAQKFLDDGLSSESFKFGIEDTSDAIVITISRVDKTKQDWVAEGMTKIAKSINDSTVSFLPSGGCPCCGR